MTLTSAFAWITKKADERFGFLSIPHSRGESAWGSLRAPVVVNKNGGGPSILLTDGNLGYE